MENPKPLKKDPFEGYVPYGSEWHDYMMRQTKTTLVALVKNVSTQRAEKDKTIAELRSLLERILDNGYAIHSELKREADEILSTLPKPQL